MTVRARTSRPSRAGTQRFAKRLRRRVLRRILGGLGIVAGTGAVGALVWAVGWSELTALEDLRVSGADDELAEAVAAAVDAPMGTPLVRIDLDALSEAAEGVPGVAGASAHHSWPRAITVTVERREPAASVGDGASWWRVDADGVLFGESDSPPAGLPVISVPTGDAVDDVAARVAAVEVLTTLPADVTEQVSELSAETAASVELVLDGGSTVMWGTANESERKAAVLLALLSDDVVHYDVSAPSHPAVRQ